jgi:hypothetical protein
MANATTAPDANVITPIVTIAHCMPNISAYCILAFEAVVLLRKHGFNAMRLEEGFPEWRAAGLPVETLGAW